MPCCARSETSPRLGNTATGATRPRINATDAAVEARPADDEEAQPYDEAFVRALESLWGVESPWHLYVGGWNVGLKLHRCPNMWVKIGAHPCWKVQKALDEQAIEYEVVKGPLRRGQRDALEKLSGQREYPVIELDDGTVYREESRDMAARIRRGGLLEDQTPGA
jgi:glutaredoxin